MAKLKTGRHTSAIKAHRKSLRNRAYNRSWKKTIRTAAKDLESAIASKDADTAKKLLPSVFAIWDKAAKSGIVHANAASRKKSRLATKVAGLSASK